MCSVMCINTHTCAVVNETTPSMTHKRIKFLKLLKILMKICVDSVRIDVYPCGMADEDKFRRVNIVLLEEQHQNLTNKNINVSGLIRDLLGDYLSDSTITIRVSEETRELYDLVVSNTGATDEDLEEPLRRTLAEVLELRISEMQALHKQLVAKLGSKS